MTYPGGSIIPGFDSATCDGTIEGAIRYNSGTSCAEFCNGTDWVCPNTNVAGCESPDSSCKAIGEVYSDQGGAGAILAGFLANDDGSCRAVFVTDNNQSTSSKWKTATGTNDITNATDEIDHVDGRYNRDNRGGGTFPAFELCENLHITTPSQAHGKSDWYLPSIAELNLLWLGRLTINANATGNFTSAPYWTSTEVGNNNAYYQSFAGAGEQGTQDFIKSSNLDVRCVRTLAASPPTGGGGGGGSCDTTPTTYDTPGSNIYTVPAGCSSVLIEAWGAGGGYDVGGGGGGSVVERADSTLLAAGGGGGGGGGNSDGGGGGGFGSATVSVSAGEQLTVYVGGGGECVNGAGGAEAGGAGEFLSFSGPANGGNSTYGGGGAASVSSASTTSASGGDSVYGGGGGVHCSFTTGATLNGGDSTHGGGGGVTTASCTGATTNFGSSTSGNSGSSSGGGGGGGFGDTVIAGGNGNNGSGGSAANSGTGAGAGSGCTTSAGDGRVVITPQASGGGGGGGGCTAPSLCPNIGDVCDDGNAGNNPDPQFAGFMVYNDPNSTDVGACKALYVTNDNQSTGGDWKTSIGTDDIATDSTEDGKINDSQVANSTTFPAFKLCKDLTDGGFSDWYLPARDELHLLWKNKSAIDANAAGNFTTSDYWSSTEFLTIYAWSPYFGDGLQNYYLKTGSYDVRCVRRD